ncbi:A24 family peptidase [Trinickia dinghuensis]|uniref:A24 family peptidase n=1 Tax=Trinickia dinghuensis TaxID=2291023 RepID=UPI0015F13416|nr:prepilin peptidase [Trinickia dinghuensis]
MILSLPPQPIPPLVVGLVVLTASTDIVCRRIPNAVIAIGLVAAFVIQAFLFGPVRGFGDALAGTLSGFALLLPLYLLRATAAGDVKLLAMIGAWVGPTMILHVALTAFVIGGVWSIVWTLYRGRMQQFLLNLWSIAHGGWRLQQNGLGTTSGIKSVGTLPYGVAIAAATLVTLFMSTV